MGVPGLSVDFVPPAEPHKATSGDVFEVVEVGGEKEDCYYEYEDTAERS